MSDTSGYLGANVVLRLLTNDIPALKERAVKLIDNSRIVKINDVAIIETIYALAEYYKVPRDLVEKTINNLATHKKLQFDYEIFERALDIYAKRPSLSIEDCYLATKANSDNESILWTFDKKLANQSNGQAKEVPNI